MKNYFKPTSTAERYATGRPYFHEITINHIKNFLKIDKKLEAALDVACGTGLSTKAVLKIANQVYGTDSSEAMLRLAELPQEIQYKIAPAERQPFNNETFDLITVSSGVHWFDIEKFLQEANRLLKPNGYLVLYENFFLGEMLGQEADFKNWLLNSYLKRFPSPPRNDKYAWNNEALLQFGFQVIHSEKFKNIISFNIKQLSHYFTTQSNITNSIENEKLTYEEIDKWLEQELKPFFHSNETIHSFQFGNTIHYLQKI